MPERATRLLPSTIETERVQFAASDFEDKLLALNLIAQQVMDHGGGKPVDPMTIECAYVTCMIWDGWKAFREQVGI